MPASKRKAGRSTTESARKRPAKSRNERLQDDPVWMTSNSKSPLVHENLHAIYSDPATYENWTKEDWDEVRDIFPDDVALNDDGYSISMSYLSHDVDWRRLVREYQDDLGAGRHEPEWLAQAAQAMKERAQGKFDQHKEEEFEAFWGQKQKLGASHRAGESSKIRLETLLQDSILRKGDELSYRRHFKRDWGSWMVEKEMQILDVEGSSMTVAIAPGQQRFIRSRRLSADIPDGQRQNNVKPNDSPNGQQTKDSAEEGEKAGIEGSERQIELPKGQALNMKAMASPELSVQTLSRCVSTGRLSESAESDELSDICDPLSEHSPEVQNDAIIEKFNTLNRLENRILDMDGRISSKDAPATSTWRLLRARRDNQDLGSLFEMREEYFVWKDPTIVKEPKKRK